MKSNNNSKGCIIFIISLMIFVPIIFFVAFTLSNRGTSSSAGGFTIENYLVELDVKEDNKVYVRENIDVNFYEDGHHGIYRFVPEWLEYTNKNKRTIKRRSEIKIKEISVKNDSYLVDQKNKKVRIRIGDPHSTLSAGNKTYTISYTYDMGKDPFHGFDEFIFHAYGDFWGTEIKNPKMEIHMPKDFDASKIKFFKDKKRKKNVTDAVEYEVKGNIIYAEYKTDASNPPLTSALTVDIELPSGYFNGGSDNYGNFALCFIVAVVLFTGINVGKWYKYGRDKKYAETIEFYPPENLNAAEVGYVSGNESYKKLTIALVVQLAAKGYIKIDELEKNDIQITNLIPVPSEINQKNCVEVKKLKDIDDNLSSSEKAMMTYLFKKENTRLLENNIQAFLKVKDTLVSKGYIEILKSDILSQEEKLKNYEKQLEQYNRNLANMPRMTEMEKMVFDKLFENKNVVILSQHLTFYEVFDSVKETIKESLYEKIYNPEADKKLIEAFILSYISIILSLVAYYVIADLGPNLQWLYLLSFLTIPINVICTIFMRKKTNDGAVLTAKIKGFKKFLETAEKDKLEALVAQNPSYFYDILPYTYVLNISKKWIKKFENIQIPTMDIGNFDYASDSFYTSFNSNIYSPPLTSNDSSSGGGCSSCGGGGFSSGGGCSSCGGGGSW